jgi:mono/diheme cytochrome c family protein
MRVFSLQFSVFIAAGLGVAMALYFAGIGAPSGASAAAPPADAGAANAANDSKGKQNFTQACISCHGADGKGAPVPGAAAGVTLAPSLVGSKRLQSDRELVCRIVLHGLEGPNDGGETYPNAMPGFPFLDDESLSALLSYARYNFCNKAPALSTADVATVRQETAKRDKPYTLRELAKTFPDARPTTAPAAGK